MVNPVNYVILDFETTGLDPSSSEIIEIGAIRVEGLKEVDRFQSLVRPQGELPAVIAQLTGIYPEMLENQPSIEEVLPGFLDFVGDLPLVAHNAPLEQSFLDHQVSPRVGGQAFTVHNSIDPLALIFPESPSHSMEAFRKRFGISSEDAHRALQDCEALLETLVRSKEWFLEKRPFIRRTVYELLAGQIFQEKWWWSWYFDAPEGLEENESALQIPYPEPEKWGDLQELRAQDEERIEAVEYGDLAKRSDELLKNAESILDQYRYRPSQSEMSREIAHAFQESRRAAIEAPTGTGKSIAYLLPGLLASRASGAPLVVSTHSKSLQDQLNEKDIPMVAKMLGDEGRPESIRSTTVKGQENYLCLRKLHDSTSALSNDASVDERWSLAYLWMLSRVMRVAELDRVSGYLVRRFHSLPGLVDDVRSHHSTTQGPPCPFYRSCHFFNSARLAHQSDVIIANHALTFNWPAHLPKIRNLIFDEAHHLENQITDAYSLKLHESEITEILDRLNPKSRSKRRNYWSNVKALAPETATQLLDPLELLKERMSEMRSIASGVVGKREQIEVIGGTRRNAIHPAHLETLVEGMRALASPLRQIRDLFLEIEADFEKQGMRRGGAVDNIRSLSARIQSIDERQQEFLKLEQKNRLVLFDWSTRDSAWRFTIQPIEITEMVEGFYADKKSIVLTSATLTTGQANDFITKRIGLNLEGPVISLPSPYRLEKQARIYIPKDIPLPGTPEHLDALIDFTEKTCRKLEGRTLLLVASNRRLRHAADVLRERLLVHGISVFDSVSDRRAAEAFRATEKALLIGSERYGEGLDIRGPQLSCVIIEKINEAMTRGPLAEARKARTRFPLFDYDFPLRMIWLKQRVGRLIRAHDDEGTIVIFDARYHQWSASSRAIVNRTLAPMPIHVQDREGVLQSIT